MIRGHGWMQEWHETAARTAPVRARQLREAGFIVAVQRMGMQVTPVGRLRMTLVDVRSIGCDAEIPAPPKGGEPATF